MFPKGNKMALEDYMLPCPTKKFLGIECFGCGMQRSLALLLDGEFYKAFQMFPAIYTTLAFFFFVALSFIDKKRSYGSILIGLGVINAMIMVVAYFIKHPIF